MANKKRLIDANALMDVIRRHEYLLATNHGSVDYGMFTLGIQQAVDEQQTVDAVEVVHGRWHEVDGETEWEFRYRCSKCFTSSYELTNYCPNCGAKMDGDGNA